MWLQQQFRLSEPAELPFTATVSATEGGFVQAEGPARLARLRCLGSLPAPGDEVLILPIQGGYLCAGTIAPLPAGIPEVENE